MAHDVFISYASADKAVGLAVCATLENNEVRCWIAPRDVVPGREYGAEIVEAIGVCNLLVLIFSSHANESSHVRREVERAISKGNAIIPFRIEEVFPTDALEYCLSNTHWLDALTPPIQLHIDTLAKTVKLLLGKEQSMGSRESSQTDSHATKDEAKAFLISWLITTLITGARHPAAVTQQIQIYLQDFGIALDRPIGDYIRTDDGGTSIMMLFEHIGGHLVAARPPLVPYFEAAFNILLDIARNGGSRVPEIIEPLEIPENLTILRENKLEWANAIQKHFQSLLK